MQGKWINNTVSRARGTANADGHVFIVNKGGSLIMKNGMVTGGFANNGGGIYNSGTLYMTDCTVSSNSGDDAAAYSMIQAESPSSQM